MHHDASNHGTVATAPHRACDQSTGMESITRRTARPGRTEQKNRERTRTDDTSARSGLVVRA